MTCSLKYLQEHPSNSLIQLKLTNKKWCALISHPLFVKLHSEHLRTDTRAARLKILVIDHLPHPSGSSRRYIDFKDSEGYRVVNLNNPICHIPAVVGGSCDVLICFNHHCYEHGSVFLCNPCTNKVKVLPTA